MCYNFETVQFCWTYIRLFRLVVIPAITPHRMMHYLLDTLYDSFVLTRYRRVDIYKNAKSLQQPKKGWMFDKTNYVT